jgi:hypothetical protein
MALGTVLDDDETFDSPRVLEAAGPGAALLFHAGYEHALLEGLDQVRAPPSGERRQPRSLKTSAICTPTSGTSHTSTTSTARF